MPEDKPLRVNAHTHLEQSWLDPYRPGVTGDTFSHWITGTLNAAKEAVGDRRPTLIREGIERSIETLRQSGTTTVGDISASGLSIEPLLESGLSGVIYIEVIAVTPEQGQAKFARAREWIERWRPHERSGMRIGFSLHAPYSLLPSFWKAGLEYVRDEALPLCIHAAESDEEYKWFTRGTGAIAERNRRMGMDFPSPGMSPIQYMEESGALELKPLLIHTVQVDDDDIARIRTQRQSGCPLPAQQFTSALRTDAAGKISRGGSSGLHGDGQFGQQPFARCAR